jgi:hypothetical protein
VTRSQTKGKTASAELFKTSRPTHFGLSLPDF